MTYKGLKVDYLEMGEGPLIVLFHGWGANKELFQTIMTVMSEKYRVVAPDVPGFGKSEEPKDNSKIYGPTTLGPYCKVGGELNNVVMFGYSNKAHEGFLGNAVIGQWCNLGAGTNASNLKNDYSEVKLWSYAQKKFVKTGLQFCGLIMGDFSKAGINTMFNTATVVGVGCNIYGAGFPRTFIPSFSEGGNAGFTNIDLNKFYDAASRMMARRNIQLTDEDKDIFKFIEDQAESFK